MGRCKIIRGQLERWLSLYKKRKKEREKIRQLRLRGKQSLKKRVPQLDCACLRLVLGMNGVVSCLQQKEVNENWTCQRERLERERGEWVFEVDVRLGFSRVSLALRLCSPSILVFNNLICLNALIYSVVEVFIFVIERYDIDFWRWLILVVDKTVKL